MRGSSSGGHSQRRHPRNMQQIGGWGGGSSPLCVLVRPRPPEQHRHTPSLRGGTLRKGKGEKSKAVQREREREREREVERGRERLRERGRREEGGRGRLADVTSALTNPCNHGHMAAVP